MARGNGVRRHGMLAHAGQPVPQRADLLHRPAGRIVCGRTKELAGGGVQILHRTVRVHEQQRVVHEAENIRQAAGVLAGLPLPEGGTNRSRRPGGHFSRPKRRRRRRRNHSLGGTVRRLLSGKKGVDRREYGGRFADHLFDERVRRAAPLEQRGLQLPGEVRQGHRHRVA